MAFGLDRLVMLILGLDDIRDVIAFPKVQNASELMSRCPSLPDPKAWRSLASRSWPRLKTTISDVNTK